MDDVLLKAIKVLHNVLQAVQLPEGFRKCVGEKVVDLLHIVDDQLTEQMEVVKFQNSNDSDEDDGYSADVEDKPGCKDKGTDSPSTDKESEHIPKCNNGKISIEAKNIAVPSAKSTSQYHTRPTHKLTTNLTLIFQPAMEFASVLPIVDNIEDEEWSPSAGDDMDEQLEDTLSDECVTLARKRIKKLQDKQCIWNNQTDAMLQESYGKFRADWSAVSTYLYDLKVTPSQCALRWNHLNKSLGEIEWNERRMKKLKHLVLQHCGGSLPGIDWLAVSRGMKVGRVDCIWKWNEMCAAFKRCC